MVCYYIPILQMGKLRHRKVKYSPKATEVISNELALEPRHLVLESVFFFSFGRATMLAGS